MDTITSLSSLPLISLNSKSNTIKKINPSVKSSINNLNSALGNSTKQTLIRVRELKVRVKAVDEVSAAVANADQAQLTWEIIVGSLVLYLQLFIRLSITVNSTTDQITLASIVGAAGVIPFIVAGIEFNKRIVAQRRCEVCGGSGLVLRDKKYYFRCPSCGGFLPWQSWRRFFSG